MRPLALLILTLALTGCGSAPTPDSEALTVTDAARLAAIFTAADLDATVFDDGSVVLKEYPLQALVFIEDDGESLQAVFPFVGIGLGDLAKVARWNSERRFGRAYIDEDGDPLLASDLLLGEGVGEEAVAAWGRLVLSMLPVFRDEVWPRQSPGAEPVNE